ncbi:MAG: hypothetical protein ABJB11_16030 [Ferruginibacter sp.]
MDYIYSNGYDDWTSWRRLDYPILPIQIGSGFNFADLKTQAFSTRLGHPLVNQNLDKNEDNTAAMAIIKE